MPSRPEQDINDEFRFQDMVCYADPEDRTAFYYRPGPPMPERDPSRRPVLILWLGDTGSRLQLCAQWAAEEAALAALRMEIVRRFQNRTLTPASVRLLPELAEIDRVALEFGDGSGAYVEVQTSRSSGYPPYSALFNIALTPEQAGQAARALNGTPDCLRVTYRGTVRRAGIGTVPLESSADVSAWFPAGSGQEHIRIIPS